MSTDTEERRADAAEPDQPTKWARLRVLAQRLGLGALVGLLAAGTAVGVGELIAAFVRPVAAPVIAVGNKFVLLTPEPLKEFAIRQFGTNDKKMLQLGIYVTIAVLAVVLGLLALRWIWVGLAGLVLFGAVGVFSALTANGHRDTDVIPTLVGTLAAMIVLVLLVSFLRAVPVPDLLRNRAPRPDKKVAFRPGADGFRPRRRSFLIATAGTAGVAAATGFGGRALQAVRFDASKSRASIDLPAPKSPAPALPSGVDIHKGSVPFITQNKNFYRVDTALSVPQLNASTWELKITGMVDHPMTLSYKDLLGRDLIERYITLTCVSNPVGGPYVSCAKFLGAPLKDLLQEAGVQQGADQIVGKSSDGMTIGTPVSVMMNTENAMIAVGQNGEPLPLEHGFPARTIVPGLYGYVSGTKWLIELEATTFDAYDTYWVKRKWAPKAPIRMSSRIDTPKGFASAPVGKVTNIAGVAWHQTVGIAKVEVRVDDGGWDEARLARVPNDQTWVQWVYPWTPKSSGPHTLTVRATDSDGVLQDEKRRDVFPSGSSGWHSVVVQS